MRTRTSSVARATSAPAQSFLPSQGEIIIPRANLGRRLISARGTHATAEWITQGKRASANANANANASLELAQAWPQRHRRRGNAKIALEGAQSTLGTLRSARGEPMRGSARLARLLPPGVFPCTLSVTEQWSPPVEPRRSRSSFDHVDPCRSLRRDPEINRPHPHRHPPGRERCGVFRPSPAQTLLRAHRNVGSRRSRGARTRIGSRLRA